MLAQQPQQLSLVDNKYYRAFFIAIALGCLFISAQIALLIGIACAIVGNPFLALSKKLTPKILSLCIIGLGCGMNLFTVMDVGLQGFFYTFFGISCTLFFGHFLAKIIKTEKETALLISVGTAICGGSAIVALSSAIKPKDSSVSLALVTVFLLNALALVLFPMIGHGIGLSEEQFGYWSALAIHDTSSVVGATLAYGPLANVIGTSVKLARALWIVPVTLVLAAVLKTKDQVKAKPPYFILGFLAASALVSFLPSLNEIGLIISNLAKQGLSLALFLIGAGLNKNIFSLGLRPLAFGIILWILVALASLAGILWA